MRVCKSFFTYNIKVSFLFLSLTLLYITSIDQLLNACIISCIIKLFIDTPVLVSLQAVFYCGKILHLDVADCKNVQM